MHVVHVIQREKNENKNDFTIDFFNLTRHFLLTQMKIKAVAYGRDHFTANYSKPAKINLNI